MYTYISLWWLWFIAVCTFAAPTNSSSELDLTDTADPQPCQPLAQSQFQLNDTVFNDVIPELYRYRINTIPAVILRQDALRAFLKTRIPKFDPHGDIPSEGFEYNTGTLTFRARPQPGGRVIWLNLHNSITLMKAHYQAGKTVQMTGVKVTLFDPQFEMIFGEIELTRKDDVHKLGECGSIGDEGEISVVA